MPQDLERAGGRSMAAAQRGRYKEIGPDDRYGTGIGSGQKRLVMGTNDRARAYCRLLIEYQMGWRKGDVKG